MEVQQPRLKDFAEGMAQIQAAAVAGKEHTPITVERQDNGTLIAHGPPGTSPKDLMDAFLSYDEKVKSDGGSTSYYQLPPGVTELGDLIDHKNMDFNLGNIFKACYRLGEKAGAERLYDINKIIFFAERMKAREEKRTSDV